MSTVGRINLGALSADVEFVVETQPDGSVVVRPTGLRLVLQKPGAGYKDPPVEVGRLVYIDPVDPSTDGEARE